MCLYLLMLTYISCLKLSLPALVYLQGLFGVSDEHMKLTVTSFLFSFGISIYIWGILIAKYKRRTIIYMAFSLWGLQQVSFIILNVIILFKYRNLIPLMYILWIFTWLMRPLVVSQLYPLTSEYASGITPGKAGLPFMLFYLLVMLIMSLSQPKDKAL